MMVISPLFVAAFGAPDLLDNYTLTQVLGLRYSFKVFDVTERSFMYVTLQLPFDFL
jgi:hypothetical protein